MKIAEAKPSVREFTLTVTTDELRLIENALLDADSADESGTATNYDVWNRIHGFMDENNIQRIEDKK